MSNIHTNTSYWSAINQVLIIVNKKSIALLINLLDIFVYQPLIKVNKIINTLWFSLLTTYH